MTSNLTKQTLKYLSQLGFIQASVQSPLLQSLCFKMYEWKCCLERCKGWWWRDSCKWWIRWIWAEHWYISHLCNNNNNHNSRQWVSECEPAPHLQQQGPRQPLPPTTQDIFREFCNTYRSILYLHNLPCAMDKLNTFQKCLGLFINLRTKDDERCHSDANSEVYVDKTWQLYCTQTTNIGNETFTTPRIFPYSHHLNKSAICIITCCTSVLNLLVKIL